MKPSKYRKKPAVVEVMQWDGTFEGSAPVVSWVDDNGGHAVWSEGWEAWHDGDEWIPARADGIYIHTLEGVMLVSAGDYIIKGVKGEFYPCKPDIFAETYEAV